MKLNRIAASAILLFFFGTTASASTILHGTQLSFHHEYNGNQFWAQDFTVGAGVDVTVGPYYTIDIEDDQLTFEMGPWNFTQNNGFNGFVIRDLLNNAPSFLSASLISSSFPGQPGITITEDEIRFDFSTTGSTANGTAVFEFEIAPVPLTSSLAFMAMGIGGFAVVRRRQKLRPSLAS
jgi:hypothetical protein